MAGEAGQAAGEADSDRNTETRATMGLLEDAIATYSYVGLWISLSAGVILYNKYVLTSFGFPFPVTLTMIHMAFCSVLAFVIVRVLKVVKA